MDTNHYIIGMNIFRISTKVADDKRNKEKHELSSAVKLFGKNEFSRLMKKNLGVPVQLFQL